MKKILIVIAVLVAALVTYNYVTTGRLSLVPSAALSEDEQSLRALEDRFSAASKEYSQATRTAGLSGLDTTAEAEAALRSVGQIEKELKSLRQRLTSQSEIQRADYLASAVREFSRRLS